MSYSTPLGGFPVPENGDPYDIEAMMTALVRDNLDGHVPGIFATANERDIAYSRWVAAGHALINGVSCFVAGKPMVYRGGQWRGVLPEPPVFVNATRTLPLSRSDDVEDSFVQATVPDPGYPYFLEVETTASTVASGGWVDIRVRAGNGFDDDELPIITHAANYGLPGLDVVTPRRHTGTLTGNSRIIGYAVRLGGGFWTINSASLSYRVWPA